MSSSTKPKRRYLRFGLFELLLVTGVLAAWFPTFIAVRQIPELESKLQLFETYSTDLELVGPNQLCLRKLKSISHNSGSWKYALPADAKMEIRLATEQLNSLNLPNQYEAFQLPVGEHRIDMREYIDRNEVFVNEVYVDDEMALTSRHPKSWMNKGNSSNLPTRVSLRSIAFPLTETLKLRTARYSIKNLKVKGFWTTVYPPDEYDGKGCYLWIVPSDDVAKPSPNFVSFRTPNFSSYQQWGHRQGIRITQESPTIPADYPGLIKLLAGFEATFGDSRTQLEATNGLSIRPIVAATEEAETQKAELPELQPSFATGNPGLQIYLSESLDPPGRRQFSPLLDQGALESILPDSKTMRIFCHYEDFSCGFPNGAKPVIEAIFDADHPNRIGLLPHQAAGSKPIKAIQIVTTMDARFRRRKMDVVGADGGVQTVPLPKKERSVNNSDEAWQTIELTQIPIDQSKRMRKLKFSTDVKDFTKVSLPPMADPIWEYMGVPNCQTWWLPLASTSGQVNQNFKVEILQTEKILTGLTLPAKVAIPGGPVIKSVRITIPMPATQPIWLKIAPEH
ncbi:hypothetical protein OAG71_00945 [bacterium]|nr:hypothetical protein [bacterium]